MTYQIGQCVTCNGNKNGIVRNKCGDGMWEVDLYDSTRYVGRVCVCESDLDLENPPVVCCWVDYSLDEPHIMCGTCVRVRPQGEPAYWECTPAGGGCPRPVGEVFTGDTRREMAREAAFNHCMAMVRRWRAIGNRFKQ
jgi:hypothetical protein